MTDIIMIIILILITPPLLWIAFLVEREGSKQQARRDAADKAWAEQQAWDEIYGCPGHSRWAPKNNDARCASCIAWITCPKNKSEKGCTLNVRTK